MGKIEHLEWKEDITVGVEIPYHTIFSSKNAEYEINFSTKLITADSPGIKVHPLLPEVFVSEQIVEYEGSVSKGEETLHTFKGRGFQEWPGKTWKKIPLNF